MQVAGEVSAVGLGEGMWMDNKVDHDHGLTEQISSEACKGWESVHKGATAQEASPHGQDGKLSGEGEAGKHNKGQLGEWL